MTRHELDLICRRVGTNSQKWDMQLERFTGHEIVAGMGIADMDFATAPAITAAMRDRLAHENWGYIRVPQSHKDTIIGWNKARYDESIDRGHLLLCPGVISAMRTAIRAFAPPGSKVIVQSPVYYAFYLIIDRASCIPVENPLRWEGDGYAMDFDDLESRIDENTRVLLLSNPHNPTGNCWSQDDLLRLGEICARHGVIVLADEIHCDIVLGGQTYTPFASLDDNEIVRNSISFKSTSKSFNLAALQTGYLYSRNNEHLERLKRIGLNQLVNEMGLIAADAAYQYGAEWLDQVITYIESNLDYAVSFVNEQVSGISVYKPQATYFAWLDCREISERIGAAETAAAINRSGGPDAAPVHPEHVLERYFVETAGVHLSEGHQYGTGGSGHMRLNAATSRELLRSALDGIAQASAP